MLKLLGIFLGEFIFFGIICYFLFIGFMGLTYSEFTYENELSGSIVTVCTLKTLYTTLTEKTYALDTNVNFGEGLSSTNGQG